MQHQNSLFDLKRRFWFCWKYSAHVGMSSSVLYWRLQSYSLRFSSIGRFSRRSATREIQSLTINQPISHSFLELLARHQCAHIHNSLMSSYIKELQWHHKFGTGFPIVGGANNIAFFSQTTVCFSCFRVVSAGQRSFSKITDMLSVWAVKAIQLELCQSSNWSKNSFCQLTGYMESCLSNNGQHTVG